jgi:hypothetical protein
LPDGSHNLIVYAKDTTGNIGASRIVYFIINTQKPIFSTIESVSIAIAVLIISGSIGFAFYRRHKRAHLEKERISSKTQ